MLWDVGAALMRWHPHLLCRVPAAGTDVFLTFDDGPDPEATPRVLDTLAKAGAKATFFLIGEKAERHPALVERLRTEGHAIGNHTWRHEDAWRTPRREWLRSVQRGQEITGSDLFRPPYGHLTPGLVSALHPQHRIVQWEVLAGDFDPRMDPPRMARRVVRRTRPGSIVVFHDTARCWSTLGPALPVMLAAGTAQGLTYRNLDQP